MRFTLAALSLGIAVTAASTRAASIPLLNADAAGVKAATVEHGVLAVAKNGRLRLTGDTGEARLSLAPRGDAWDLSGCEAVEVSVTNVSSSAITARLLVADADAKGLTGVCRNAGEIAPGESATVRTRLVRRPQDPTFEPFRPFIMYFKGINVRDNTLDASKVVRVTLAVTGADLAKGVELSPIVSSGEGKPAPAFLPFVDEYGQYVHSDWPGKVHTDADFGTLRAQEAKEMAGGRRPRGWDQYGGWADGPTLKATGFFYPTKHDGKWWLVDPDGKLFWSYGPTGVGLGGDVTPVSERENWFTSLPPADGPLGQFYSTGRGAMFKFYQKRDWRGFDIQQANLMRKYGPDYRGEVARLSHERLHNWGFNTMGNWSSPEIYSLRRTPYTVAINSPSVSMMTGGDGHAFQDVYDERWEPGLYATMEKQRGKTAGDPWCIGYFVDNERCIGARSRGAMIAEMALKAGPEQPAKLELIKRLRAKYADITALNAAWKSDYASWDAVRDRRDPPSMKDNAAMLADGGDFGMAFCERYFSVAQAAVKKVAPNNLFLGTRFYGHTDPEVVAVAARHMDVISYNIYENPPDGRVRQFAAIDKPLLITEWGIGSDVMQTPFRDEKLTAPTPAERAAKLTGYVQHALALPNVVGAHFFQFRDQPISGRRDGEATLRGFINVADTPNFELVAANRLVASTIYTARAKAN